MGRARKERVTEYAGLLAKELRRALGEDLERSVARVRGEHAREIAGLRRSIASLERRIELLLERERGRRRIKLGRWVPGGPGRPPKDAAARIAAYQARAHRRPK